MIGDCFPAMIDDRLRDCFLDVARALDSLRSRNHGCRHFNDFSSHNRARIFRTDVVVIISPILNSGAAIEMRFGRERRPTDVVTTLAPRNPRRCPFVTWDPDPADVAQAGPSTVVISRPAEWLFRNPCPTGLG